MWGIMPVPPPPAPPPAPPPFFLTPPPPDREVIAAAASRPQTAVHAPYRIARLGEAPLTQPIRSTPELRRDLVRYRRIYRAASERLGLSRREYARIVAHIRRGSVSYGELPQQLDAMTWSANGRVFALRNVDIPKRTFGWQVQLVESHQTVDVYIPARCGNMSVVRTPIAGTERVVQIPAPEKKLEPLPTKKAEVAYEAAPAPVPAPVEYAPPSITMHSPPAAHHGHGHWYPLLLIPVIALLGFHGSHSSAPPVLPIAGCTTPAANGIAVAIHLH